MITAQTTQAERDLFLEQATNEAFRAHAIGLGSTLEQVRAAEAEAQHRYERKCRERALARGMLMGR
jgi:hypothetical protein